MKFIQVNNDTNVRKEDIIAIERIDDMTCKVITNIGAFESMYPSWRVLQLLEQPDIEENLSPLPEQTPNRVNLWGNQHFAG